MWIWRQSLGRLLYPNGDLLAVGYSGKDAGKNNVAFQYVKNVGPIPQGCYLIQEPVETATHGPYVLWLEPADVNDMRGRSDFGIHGDNRKGDDSASEGCIILPREAREAIWDSGDHLLQVIA